MIRTIKEDFNRLNKKGKYILKAIFIFLLFMFIDYINLIPIYLFNITNFQGPVVVILDTFKNLVMITLLFLIYRKELIQEWDKFRANIIDNLDVGVKYWFVGLLIMITSNLLIAYLFNSTGASNEIAVQNYISYLPWLMFINAGIIGPFIEEMVFRKAFKDAIKNKWLYVFISALIFGSLHLTAGLTAWYDIFYIIPYSALGGAFALANYETDTIFTSITLHITHNSILLLSSILTLYIV